MKTSLDYTMVIYGYELIYGYKGGGLERVSNELKNYNLYGVLETCSKIALTLFSRGQFNQETQIKLIKDIFAKNLYIRQRMADAIKKGGHKEWVIFTDQAVLVLVKLALTNCRKDTGKPIANEDVNKVGHWLLIITDECVGSGVPAPLILPPLYEREYARGHFARQHFLMDNERINYRIARFNHMFNFISKKYPDFAIEEKFALATNGAPFKEYLHFCFYLLVEWVNRKTREVDIKKEWITCWTKYFGQTKLEKDKVAKLGELLLLDIENYTKNYEDEVNKLLHGRDEFAYNFLQLRRKPFIPINRDCFVCPSPDFLMEKSTEGVYWVLENYFQDKRLTNLADLLPSVWGNSFESYINQCFVSAFGKSNYVPNMTINGEEKLDGVLNLEKIVCFIEIKYAHWSLKAKTTGEASSMMVTLKQLLSNKKGLGQIIRSVKEVADSDWAVPFELRKRVILPIIVVGEAMPMDMLNWRFYEDYASSEGIEFKKGNLLPFIILDAEEIEMLEAIAREDGIHVAERLLTNYSLIFTLRTERGYAGGAMSFRNFLHSRSIKVPNNKRLIGIFDKIADEARKRAFPNSKPFSKLVPFGNIS